MEKGAITIVEDEDLELKIEDDLGVF